MPISPLHLRRALMLCLSPALPLSAATVDYEKQLLPVLKDNCLPCHNKTTTKGGLDMESVELMLKGGDNGPSLLPGDGAKSLLYQAAAGEWDSEMPPKNNKVSAQPLNSGQLALLRQWIDEGAHHRGKQQRVIAWQPLPAGFTPIYAAAITRDGQFAAAARGNQVSIYHLPTTRLVTRLTDDALIQSGLYSKPGIAHRDVVPALAFSPDGQRLVTGSYREVKVWRLTPHTAPKPTNPAPTAPSQFKLAPTTPDTLALQDSASGKTLRTVQHGAAITASAISPDGQKLATAGTDHKLKLWETSTGKLLREITGDLDSAHSLNAATLAADRATLEATWWTEQLQKSDKETTDLNTRLKKGQELQTTAQKTLEDKRRDAQAKATAQTQAEAAVKALETPPPAPSAATPATAEATPAPQPDAAQTQKLTAAREAAAKASTEAKTAQEALTRAQDAVQDAAHEIQLVTRLITESQQATTAAKAALTQSQKAQAKTAQEKTAALESAAKALPRLQSLTFSPDGTQLAGLDSQNRLHIWATHTGIALASTTLQPTLSWPDARGPTLHSPHAQSPTPLENIRWQLERTFGSGDTASPITDRVNALAFSPDGKTLAVGSGEPSRSGDITLWDTATGSLKARWDEVHLDSVLTLAFSPDGHHLASGAADKNLRILHTVTGKVQRVLEGHTHHILSTAWRADGRLLATAGADAVVKVWDTTTGERRQNITGWDKEITALHWLGATDTLATTSGEGRIRLITSAGKEVKALPSTPDFQNTLALTPEGQWLLTGGQDGTLRLWSTLDSREAATFSADQSP